MDKYPHISSEIAHHYNEAAFDYRRGKGEKYVCNRALEEFEKLTNKQNE